MIKRSRKSYFKMILACFAMLAVAGCASAPLIRPAAPRIAGFYYPVKKSQTLWRISKMYNISLEEIVRINNISDATQVEEGQLILIPGERREPKAVAAPVSSSPSGYDAGEFIWPLKGKVISTFGQTYNFMLNKGINIRPYGNPDVLASRPGRAVFCDDNFKSYGKTVIIDHGDGFLTVYAMNSEIFIRPGDTVPQGKRIARCGPAKDQYVHFEIRKTHKSENPLFYLP